MAKISVNGELFDYDGNVTPVSEALAIEEAYGYRYVQWQQDLAAGSARALCTLAWLLWHREGRDVALDDILTDKVPLDLNELILSCLTNGAAEARQDADPTTTPPGTPGRDGTPTTAAAT